MRRRFFVTYLSASLVLAVPAMILVACGGGGGGGGEVDRGPLTGLSIDGPSSVTEYVGAEYTATASWSDNSTTVVTPSWSVDPQVASIGAGGVLLCSQIDSDQTVTITATFSSGGITETAAMDVTVTNVNTIPFTAQMLSGQVFYEENVHAGGTYESSLYYFNADSGFAEDWYESDGSNGRLTGSWSIDPSGKLIVSVAGQGTSTATLLAETATEMQVWVDEGSGYPINVILEKTIPADPAKVPGTYLSQTGSTWTFNPNGTGSTTGGGGWGFTWSVDSGILKNVFSNGYVGWFHARASTQSTGTAYTVLKVGFAEYAPGGILYGYHGGRVLTRQ